jgi:hypothetical protein
VNGVKDVERDVEGNDKRVSQGIGGRESAAFNQEEKLGTVRMFLSDHNQATKFYQHMSKAAGPSYFCPFCFDVHQ